MRTQLERSHLSIDRPSTTETNNHIKTMKAIAVILFISAVLVQFSDQQDVQDTICSLKPDPGFCKALFYRYYYDPSKGKCELFNYGGCRGNANNFETLEACEAACVQGKATEAAPL
ncbi:U-actitoxin-Avd3r [Bulinus truncatus]|nr:U-actitoxin-Avd3r [Bulinus truncatus]